MYIQINMNIIMQSLIILICSFHSILYRKLQQPLTSTERAQLDSMLLTTLQVLSGVVIAKREKIKSEKEKTPEK